MFAYAFKNKLVFFSCVPLFRFFFSFFFYLSYLYVKFNISSENRVCYIFHKESLSLSFRLSVDAKILRDAAEDVRSMAAREIFAYTWRISESNRDAIEPRSILESPVSSFISYARRIIVREQREGGEKRDTNSPHLSFKLDFSSAILAVSVSARARSDYIQSPFALIGRADRFGMECSTYFLSFARKNPFSLSLSLSVPSPRSVPIWTNLNDIVQFTLWWKHGKSTRTI